MNGKRYTRAAVLAAGHAAGVRWTATRRRGDYYQHVGESATATLRAERDTYPRRWRATFSRAASMGSIGATLEETLGATA